ncbi:MAG: GNAT family N-acetyltransferase [Acidobacteriota bacterium]
MTAFRVRPAEREDAAAWLGMRQALWPEDAEGEHAEEIEEFFSGRSKEPLAVLIAEGESGRLIGIAELSIRTSAEGCRTDRVAYLEGWFVMPESRRQGVGRALIAAAEEWGRAYDCDELASDTQPENEASVAAHRAAGFTDAGVVQCYRKEL